MYEQQYQNYMPQIEDKFNHETESDSVVGADGESEKKMQPDLDGESSKEMVGMEVDNGFSSENGKGDEN